MRILGFATDWPKLEQPVFTTFRYRRADVDWREGELVEVRVGARTKGGGRRCGKARIISKERKYSEDDITEQEAIEDGFQSKAEMVAWLNHHHSVGAFRVAMFKYTLRYTRGVEEMLL